MNPFDQYLEEVYQGRQKPVSSEWRLEINYVDVGELSLARINGPEFYCWFWPAKAFSQYESDFERHTEEARRLCISLPNWRKKSSWFVPKKDAFKRDEALFEKLIMLRSTVREKASGETILRAHILSISEDKAWFTPRFKNPQIPLPYPDSNIFEIPSNAEKDWSWKLLAGEKVLGSLELMEVDQPSIHCAFREGPCFEEYRPLFDAQRRASIEKYNNPEAKSEFEEVQRKIVKLTLQPATPDTKPMGFALLYINGPLAHFRPIVRDV